MRTALRILCVVVALTVVATPPAYGRDYDWPLTPRPSVATAFANPDKRWQPGHRGVDLAATPGQTVYSAAAGRVHHVGRVSDRIVVSVLHRTGLLTTYEPIDEPAVRIGQEVAIGTALGRVAAGHDGCPIAACLHWGLRRGAGRAAQYFNPLLLVAAAPVRLLPDHATQGAAGEK